MFSRFYLLSSYRLEIVRSYRKTQKGFELTIRYHFLVTSKKKSLNAGDSPHQIAAAQKIEGLRIVAQRLWRFQDLVPGRALYSRR